MIEFVDATINDLQNIVATYNSTIPHKLATADLEVVTVDSKLDWFHNHTPSTRPLWLILHDGNYAGWLSYNSFYGRPAYNGTAEISIYIEDTYKGKGIGKTALKKAIDTAPSLNIDTLLGFIFAHNIPSVQLFKTMGFETWGHLPEVADMKGFKADLMIFGKKVR